MRAIKPPFAASGKLSWIFPNGLQGARKCRWVKLSGKSKVFETGASSRGMLNNPVLILTDLGKRPARLYTSAILDEARAVSVRDLVRRAFSGALAIDNEGKVMHM